MELTKKQKAYIEYSVANPLLKDAEIAREIGVTHKQICKWKQNPEFQAEITKLLDKQWKEYRKVAQQTMLNLATNGDRQAAQFILQTTGVNPEQNVNVNAEINTIKVEVID